MQRYEKIMTISDSLYQKNCPIIFVKGALLKDNKLNKNILQLQFKNLGANICKAVYVSIECSDIENKKIEMIEKKYIDLELKYSSAFGENIPIELSSDLSRKFQINIDKIIFKDDSIVEYSGGMCVIEAPDDLKELNDLKNQFIREVEKDNRITRCTVKPTVINGLWYCACGALNHDSNDKCGMCKIDREKLFSFLNTDFLEEQNNEYLRQKEIEENERKLQEEKRLEELRQQEEAEKEKKKKHKKILIILVIIAIMLAVLYGLAIKFVVPSIKYSSAIKAMENGNYEEGYQILTDLGDYQDSREQIKKGKYKQANELFEKTGYTAAIKIFEELGEYEDSLLILKEAKYLMAKEYLTVNDMKNAVKLLVEIEGYKDSKELCENTKYGEMIALAHIEPETVIEYFENEGAELPNAKEILLDAKAYYVANNKPYTCEEYIKIHPYLLDLKNENYRDFAKLYDKYYPKVFVLVNYDSEDIYNTYSELNVRYNEDFYLHIINIGVPYQGGEIMFWDDTTGIGGRPSVKWQDVYGNEKREAGVHSTWFMLSKEIFENNSIVDLNCFFKDSTGEVIASQYAKIR